MRALLAVALTTFLLAGCDSLGTDSEVNPGPNVQAATPQDSKSPNYRPEGGDVFNFDAAAQDTTLLRAGFPHYRPEGGDV
ncbi:MAG: hypothetical protein AAGG50_11830 [Bacteroidota bacterium]